MAKAARTVRQPALKAASTPHQTPSPDASSAAGDRIGPFLIMLAAFLMAAGVADAAAAAHADAARELSAAALLMTTNAPMVGLIGLGIACGKLPRVPAAGGAFAAFLGAVLFSADMLSRVYGSGRLFAYAAPTGGSLIIAGWTIIGVAMVWTVAKRR
ncbi:MAG: DUF423 domain-containing protein [Ancalomicrobiaceae bacterium]|nr:DUF423 domain-containing protein [Ancalomicrobiaceae bacterium]